MGVQVKSDRERFASHEREADATLERAQVKGSLWRTGLNNLATTGIYFTRIMGKYASGSWGASSAR